MLSNQKCTDSITINASNFTEDYVLEQFVEEK